MPSTATITTFYTFVADTRARASHANTNFSAFRGHLISLDPNTATSTDNTYDIGSDEHRWRTAYVRDIDLETSTTTASLIVCGETAAANGAFLFKVEGAIAARVKHTGFDGTTLDPYSVPYTALNTASAYLVISKTDCNVTQTLSITGSDLSVWVTCIGGGGGGGAGGTGNVTDSGGGGGGGQAGSVSHTFLGFVGPYTLSITVGSAGGAGATGGASSVMINGTNYAFAYGGTPGDDGQHGTGGGAGGAGGNGGYYRAAGGAGAVAAASGAVGQDGPANYSAKSGAGGTGGLSSGGGGGGGQGCYYISAGSPGTGGVGGGGGGAGTNGVAGNAGDIGAGGGGGGGGGAGGGATTGGVGGVGGPGRVFIHRLKFRGV